MRRASKAMRKINGGRGNQVPALVPTLGETAVRSVVTATVTFGVGWLLKRMFEKSVVTAAQAAKKPAKPTPSKSHDAPPTYKVPEKRLPASKPNIQRV